MTFVEFCRDLPPQLGPEQVRRGLAVLQWPCLSAGMLGWGAVPTVGCRVDASIRMLHQPTPNRVLTLLVWLSSLATPAGCERVPGYLGPDW